MHPDTEALLVLWEADRALDALEAEARRNERSVAAAAAAEQEALRRVKDAEARLVALKREEHAHDRRLSSYSERLARTRRLIDQGQAPDFAAATRQVEQCSAIVDQEETAILEVFERQESAARELAAAREMAAWRSHELERARTRRADRAPSLERELRAARQAVEAAREPVPQDLLQLHDDLRRRGRNVFADVVDGNCSACNMRVTAGYLAEHRRGAAVHRCGNCGRFLGAIREGP